MKVKEKSEKAGLKLSVKKTKIVASGPITSWQIEGEKVEAVTVLFLGVFSKILFFEGSKITLDDDCSHKIKRCLLLRRKAMTNLDSVLKSRHILPTRVCISQSYSFSSSHVRVGP